jgi:hypothetical protein
MTPKLPDRTQRSIDVLIENIARYRRGDTMLNALTPRDVFTKGAETERRGRKRIHGRRR